MISMTKHLLHHNENKFYKLIKSKFNRIPQIKSTTTITNCQFINYFSFSLFDPAVYFQSILSQKRFQTKRAYQSTVPIQNTADLGNLLHK